MGVIAILAFVGLSWCSYQWSALLARNTIQLPTPSWWHQAPYNASLSYTATKSASPRVQYHEWTITRADIAPDGVTRPMILVNNHYPRPPISANVGDTLVIKVNNLLTTNDTSSFSRWDRSALNQELPPLDIRSALTSTE